MPKYIMFTGLRPRSALGWCTICSMLYKGYALAELEEEITKAPEDAYTWMDLPAPHDETDGLAEAVAYGYYMPWSPPSFGGDGRMPLPVPLCWSHLMPIKVTLGLAPATAAEAAALAAAEQVGRTPGGGVDLAERQAALQRARRQ